MRTQCIDRRDVYLCNNSVSLYVDVDEDLFSRSLLVLCNNVILLLLIYINILLIGYN